MSINYPIEVYDADNPLFSTVARMINPKRAEADEVIFDAAYASVYTVGGDTLDISYFYQPPLENPWDERRNIFDRHIYTEELWIVTEGDFILPCCPCDEPDNLQAVPVPEKMMGFRIYSGDIFVLKANVWHTGPWAIQRNKAFKFFMALNGHREGKDGNKEDHITKSFLNDAGIVPKFH